MAGRKWTLEEDERLKSLRSSFSIDELANIMQRSRMSISVRLCITQTRLTEKRSADVPYRKCSKCNLYKNRDEFTNNKAVNDGLASRCRKCGNEACRVSYIKNREKILDKAKLKPKLNSKRRAKKYGAAGKHTTKQWIARVDYYGWKCAYCTCLLNRSTLTKDHVIPLCNGGSEWASNLVPACMNCNKRKNRYSVKAFLGKIKCSQSKTSRVLRHRSFCV